MFNLSVKVHAEKTRVKINQLETVHFIKVNELKLTQVELFYFLHFTCISANPSECFVWLI